MEQIAEELQAVLETQPDASSLFKYNRVLLLQYDLVHKRKVPVLKLYIARSFGYTVHDTDPAATPIARANHLLSVLLGVQPTDHPTVPLETLHMLVRTALQKPVLDALQAVKATYKDDALDAWRAALVLKSAYEGVEGWARQMWQDGCKKGKALAQAEMESTDSFTMQTGTAAADTAPRMPDELCRSIFRATFLPSSTMPADGIMADLSQIVSQMAIRDATATTPPLSPSPGAVRCRSPVHHASWWDRY